MQLLFAEGKQQNIADVRKAVADLPDVAVSSMGENDLEFKIDTSERDIRQGRSCRCKNRSASDLQTYSMAFGELAMIEAPKDEPGRGRRPAKARPGDAGPPHSPSESKRRGVPAGRVETC